MKLSKYVSQIRHYHNVYGGDVKVLYAIDEEGNAFHEITMDPTIGWIVNGRFVTADNMEDYSKLKKKYGDINAICVN